ncbi:NifB/NifX family molybdenum-iron cluster-binding protein [Clostridium ganghwense]|uniref:NifB/NifX family molybdenum-iron cluster-binding protein n=1 Tax=Clostridium ganghwense TaxID=312089 RepID=A0ABT4CJL4_9CLOT|nr:NifB/NifX family molybdenum-iron cluster-binding protein [Clostridium ganghwense]MCY6369248.1 NifB/NifX family molybdenum-iron cluster-binding protein [Clostridium ganghwense]
MKIAAPKNGDDINQHFGKSKSFAVLSVEGNEITRQEEIAIGNVHEHNHEGLAKFLASENISVILAGGMGEGMYDALESEGFTVIRGACGSYKDAANQYLNGELKDKEAMCSHHGEHHH